MGTKHTLLAGALLAAALCLFAPAVGAADAKTVGVWETDGYTVTIPATLTIPEIADGSESTSETLTVSADLAATQRLTISIASENDYHLVCTDDESSKIAYDVTSTDSNFSKTEDTITYAENTTQYTQNLKTYLTVSVEKNALPSVSGEYTDTLKFTFDAKPRYTFNVTCPAVDKYGDLKTEKETVYGFYDFTPGEKVTWDGDTLKEMGLVHDTDERSSYRWEDFTTTIPTDSYEIKVELQRKTVWFNLNGILFEDGFHHKMKDLGEMATVDITVTTPSGTEYTNPGVGDLFTTYSYGSKYKIDNCNLSTGYKLKGYFINTTVDSEAWDDESWSQTELESKGEFVSYTDAKTLSIERTLEGRVKYETNTTLVETVYLVFEKDASQQAIETITDNTTGNLDDDTYYPDDDAVPPATADTDDATDTPSDTDDVDDAEPADDPTDELEPNDADMDAAGDALDDEMDDGNANVETATEPLDILA